MSFFAVLIALLIEQVRPLPPRNLVFDVLTQWVAWCGRTFDAGKARHARLVWTITVLTPTGLIAAIHLLLSRYGGDVVPVYASALLALLFGIVVLYFTLGFRQFSHHFTDVRQALERGEEDEARLILSRWLHLDSSELPRSELLRHVIEHSLLAAHRHVFGVFFWFVLGAAVGLGPAGAVFYRMAEFTSRYWGYRNRRHGVVVHVELKRCSQQWFVRIDYLPARLTAVGFALIGNFEEAMAGWRRDAQLWAMPNEGVILAAAAGAQNMRLGGAAAPGVTPDRSKTFAAGTLGDALGAQGATPGAELQLGHLGSVVGMVWRSVLLWMALLFLLKLANLIG